MTDITLRGYLNQEVSVQEVADFVVTKLMEQGKGSVGSFEACKENGEVYHFDDIKCAYRAPDGSKCVVGWLIPDDEYVEAMDHPSEDKSKDYTLNAEQLVIDFYPEYDTHIIRNLLTILYKFQKMHDNSATEAMNGKDFKKALLERAYTHYNRHGLNTSLLDSYSVVV